MAVLAVFFIRADLPDVQAQDESVGEAAATVARSAGKPLWQRWHFVLAVVAQFLYVAAQSGVWNFFVSFVTSPDMPRIGEGLVHDMPAWMTVYQNDHYRISDGGAPLLLSFGGMMLFSSEDLAGGSFSEFFAPTPRWPFTVSARDHDAPRRAAAGLDFRGGTFHQLLLHVDHVPHHLRAGHSRLGRTYQDGLVFDRHGHCRRRAHAVVDGLGWPTPFRCASVLPCRCFVSRSLVSTPRSGPHSSAATPATTWPIKRAKIGLRNRNRTPLNATAGACLPLC